jgi:opacity protein-like surface antigen
MKKILAAALLLMAIASPAFAAKKHNSKYHSQHHIQHHHVQHHSQHHT